MAGNGPPPKDKRSRDRDMKLLNDLVYNGEIFGDPLPSGVLGTERREGDDVEVEWHPQTVLWWDAIRQWPLMEDEPQASWMFMIDTALMHHIMWSKQKWEFASEIRLREAKYGIMPDDRKRLGLRYKPTPDVKEPQDQPAEGGKASVTSIEARRQRLTKDEKPDEKTGTAEE